MITVLVASAPEVAGTTVMHVLADADIRGVPRRFSASASASGTVSLPAMVVETKADVLVCDLWTADEDTLRELRAVKQGLPHVPVIVVSVEPDHEIRRLVHATGVTRWVSRVALPLVPVLVWRAIRIREARAGFFRRKEAMLAPGRGRKNGAGDTAPLVTRSPAMEQAFGAAETQIRWGEPLFLCGEEGSGRRTMARALHARQPATGPFTVLDGRGLTETQFQRALDSGRERAHGGTLFVPAVDDLPPALQVELVCLWNEGCHLAEIKLVYAARRPHWQHDLARAITSWRVEIPPLRTRPEDIPLLARYFLLEAGLPSAKIPQALPRGIMRSLVEYSFPGNVRELQGMMIRLARTHRKPGVPETPRLPRVLRRVVTPY